MKRMLASDAGSEPLASEARVECHVELNGA
jgi:hypothetical protein